MRMTRIVSILICVVVVLSACGETGGDIGNEPTRGRRAVSTSPAPTTMPPEKDESKPEDTSTGSASSLSQYQGDVSCSTFDTWSWAQSVYVSDPERFTSLDTDGNGIACESLSVVGFAPAIWATDLPGDLIEATVVSVTDGDTITVRLQDGTTDTVRLTHLDAPETAGTIGQCGGPESTWFLGWILSYAKDGVIYLERDATERDQYDRRLAYVWFEVEGDTSPYMANYSMILAGWAESETYAPDVKYKTELDGAQKFAVDHVTGVRLLCGKFGRPANDAAPSDEQVRQAWLKQPNQGQLPAYPGSQEALQPEQPPAQVDSAPAVDTSANTGVVAVPVSQGSDSPVLSDPPTEQPSLPDPVVEQPVSEEPVVEQPVYQEPVVEEPVIQEPVNECDPSYPDFCLAPAWVIGDLDCGDIPYRRFTVYAPDSHGFDSDGDMVGCETG